MENENVIASLSKRAGGEIYLGVVGAVRTGKSTFIKRFIEGLVVPNITDEYEKKKCLDEVPQSAQGKQVMTTEPKFVPSSGAKIKVDEFETNIKLVDCVGYVINDATGFLDSDGNPRMVKSPWFDDYIPLTEAAELGTEKVIKDHATIGIVVTTDGSICDIERKDYEEAEETVVTELKEIGKPFIVIMNSVHPMLPETEKLADSLREKYNVPVISTSILNMNEKDMYNILKEALYEFPIIDVKVNMPEWIAILEPNHYLKKVYIEKIKESVIEVEKLRDIENITSHFADTPYIDKAYLSKVDASCGEVTINLEAPSGLYNQVLNEIIGTDITSKANLLSLFQDLKVAKREYDQIKGALKMVKQTGYGIASPTLADMKLDTPEVLKQGSRYGIKLKAIAPSIHMIRVDVESTFEPIIGTEVQSKELIDHLMQDKDNVWKSEIFGRSLDVIVQEGIQAKLSLMPEGARFKLQQAIGKLVNKGSGNLFAIVI